MYQPVFDHVYEVASKDETNRKLFVHNLPYEASAEAVQRLMAEYGEVESSSMAMDKVSGRNKGYAFVVYKEMSAANLAIEAAKRGAVVIDVRMRAGGCGGKIKTAPCSMMR